MWQPQVDVLFDARVVDTDAPSYQGRTPRLFYVLLRLSSDGNTLLLAKIVGLDLPLCALVCLAWRLVILCANLLMF